MPATADPEWIKRAGTLGSGGELRLDPVHAGWDYSGLRVVVLQPRQPRTIHLDDCEGVVIPLSAQDIDVQVGDHTFAVQGRAGVFARVTDWVYAPVGSQVTMTSTTGGEVAIATAVAHREFPAAYVSAQDTPVQVRGAGPATRQVTVYAGPENFPDADRVVVCELLTPDGNWSSYPPHRHDGIGDCPHTNEEIYYFRIGKVGQPHGHPDGVGLHRTYTAPEDPGTPVDFAVQVRDGDVALVPRGYHGPCVASPGYPMYYLNVLAGPNPRTFGFCDDPVHHWIRDTWADMAPDPRVPMTSADGAA